MVGNFATSHTKHFKVKVFFSIIVAICVVIMPFYMKRCDNYAEASGSAGIVMEVTTNRILGGYNYDTKMPMASTTKVMTALVVIENCNVSDSVVISKAAVGIEGSSIYLREGEKLSVKELLLGLMLRSGNDAAVALALHCGGSIENFAKLMNTKAAELGLNNTNFTNPHGLHDKNHYTTARELAVIACAGMKNSIFAEIVGTKYVTVGEAESKRTLANKNKLLFRYSGATGIKTGYTKNAGRCLVAGSKRDGMELVSVVLNCGPMYEECARLMDETYANYVMTNIDENAYLPCSIEIVDGKSNELGISALSDIRCPLRRDGSDVISVRKNGVQSRTAPVSKGEKIGEMEIFVNEHLLLRKNLYTINGTEKKTFIDKIKERLR